MFIRVSVLFLLALHLFTGYSFGSDMEEQDNEQVSQVQSRSDSSLEMLTSIIELKKTLKKRIADKKKAMDASTSDTEKEDIRQTLEKLDKQLDDTSFDFESIATGIDMALFSEKKVESFNWKDEVLSLIEPGIKELKLITLKARQKTKIKEEIAYYENLVPIAGDAIENIKKLMDETSDKTLKNNLKSLLPEWQGVKEQLENKLKITQMQLSQMENEEKSMVESSRIFVKDFFKTRGLYLFIALAACCIVIVLFRFFYLLMKKIMPGFKSESRPFYIRVIDLTFKFAALVSSLFAMIFVFYSAEDWVLLSLTIIFFLGLGWTVKNTLPRLWHQSRLILNIGSVREGGADNLPWCSLDC